MQLRMWSFVYAGLPQERVDIRPGALLVPAQSTRLKVDTDADLQSDPAPVEAGPGGRVHDKQLRTH